jgi:hypothetical protein
MRTSFGYLPVMEFCNKSYRQSVYSSSGPHEGQLSAVGVETSQMLELPALAHMTISSACSAAAATPSRPQLHHNSVEL